MSDVTSDTSKEEQEFVRNDEMVADDSNAKLKEVDEDADDNDSQSNEQDNGKLQSGPDSPLVRKFLTEFNQILAAALHLPRVRMTPVLRMKRSWIEWPRRWARD